VVEGFVLRSLLCQLGGLDDVKTLIFGIDNDGYSGKWLMEHLPPI
jgi:hypothetical protein